MFRNAAAAVARGILSRDKVTHSSVYLAIASALQSFLRERFNGIKEALRLQLASFKEAFRELRSQR